MHFFSKAIKINIQKNLNNSYFFDGKNIVFMRIIVFLMETYHVLKNKIQ